MARNAKNPGQGFIRSAPTIDHIPPDDFQPFIECDLGPFTATPPMCAEESRIFGGGHRPMILRQVVHEDGARAHGVPVTGDQQDGGRMERLKAFANVTGLSESGIEFKSADADLRGHLRGVLLEEGFSIFCGRVAEVAGVRRSVEQQVAGIAGAQQFHTAAIAFVLAVTGEDHDNVRLFRTVTHKHPAGESGEQEKSQKQKQKQVASAGSAMDSGNRIRRRRLDGLAGD